MLLSLKDAGERGGNGESESEAGGEWKMKSGDVGGLDFARVSAMDSGP